MDPIIKVPAEAMTGAQSFGIDFGGSVIKLAYTKKNDPHPEGQTLVHLKSYSRENFQEAVDFMRKEFEIPAPKDGELPEYILTGVGTHQFQKVLREQLNIRVSTTFELSCFTEAFKVLTQSLPDEELFHAPVYEDDDSVKKLGEVFGKMTKDFDIKLPEEEEHVEELSSTGSQLPCIIGMLGSAFGFVKLDEKGDTVVGSQSNRGGRMFLGLGSLLTGAKTYGELIALAKKGEDHNVHTYTKDLVKANEADEAENLYGNLADIDMLSFSYGRCVGKSISDFSREDLARAILVNICQEIVQMSVDLVAKLKATRVVLVGGFAQAPVARKIIEEEFTKATRMMAMFNPKSPVGHATLHVVKAGSHLGALGAILQSKPKPEVQPEAAAK